MPKYKLIGNKIQIWDIRFDHYSDEALSFFSKLEALAGSPPSLALSATQELIEWQNKRGEEFREAVENCRHKIQAINYNISLIESEIKNPPIPQYKLPMDLDKKEFFDDVVLFEFESFLSQVLSSLDIFIHLLKLFYSDLDSDDKHTIGFNGRGVKIKENGINKKVGIAGKKTTDILRKKSGESELANYIDEQVSVWIQEVSDLRNISAHQSRVQNLQMFLIEKNKLNAPKFSDNEKDLLEYCKETYENLKIFINYIEENFLLEKAEKFYEMK